LRTRRIVWLALAHGCTQESLDEREAPPEPWVDAAGFYGYFEARLECFPLRHVLTLYRERMEAEIVYDLDEVVSVRVFHERDGDEGRGHIRRVGGGGFRIGSWAGERSSLFFTLECGAPPLAFEPEFPSEEL